MTEQPMPVPLIDDYQKLNLHHLPDFIGELTCGISRQFQIDPVIVFGTILGCAAVATQGKIRTRVSKDWIEHSSIYIINIAETGDGKSQVMNLLRKPIDLYESQLQSDARTDYGLRKAKFEIAENKLKLIKDSMSKQKSKTPARLFPTYCRCRAACPIDVNKECLRHPGSQALDFVTADR